MARLPKTRHFQTQLQLTVFNLKRTVVPVGRFLKLKRILFMKSSIFHLPRVKIWKLVKMFRKSLLKMASIQKKADFS